MSKLVWDAIGSRYYETGVDRGVLYPMSDDGTYETGVAWNGLISVTESPSGAEATPLYADNIKYLNLTSNEEFAGSIEAYTYPDEFAECIGCKTLTNGVVVSQQKRKMFGFSYRTLLGNDTEGTDHGYKIHIVYGALASVSEKGYSSVNESPEAMTLSWEFTTTPVAYTGFKPIAHIEIDSTKVNATALAAIEDALYGSTSTTAALPSIAELKALAETPAA